MNLQTCKWRQEIVRILKFLLHFFVVMLILFAGAAGFVFIEEPENQHLEEVLTNNSTGVSSKLLTPDSFADGNSTVFLLYMSQHFNISINEEEKEDFVRTVILYNAAVEKGKQLQRHRLERTDRLFIFTKWFYFVIIASTTIGYGDVAPRTHYGRMFYIAFSVVSIPLMVTLLASCGDIMTLVSEELLSAITILLLLFAYITVGCVYTANTENWSIVDSVYFWIVTFTTVGFGDVLLTKSNTPSVIIPVTLYRCFGLALLAGCIDSLIEWAKARNQYLQAQAEKLKQLRSLKTLGGTRVLLQQNLRKRFGKKESTNFRDERINEEYDI